jgi:hypothetical protein
LSARIYFIHIVCAVGDWLANDILVHDVDVWTRIAQGDWRKWYCQKLYCRKASEGCETLTTKLPVLDSEVFVFSSEVVFIQAKAQNAYVFEAKGRSENGH